MQIRRVQNQRKESLTNRKIIIIVIVIVVIRRLSLSPSLAAIKRKRYCCTINIRGRRKVRPRIRKKRRRLTNLSRHVSFSLPFFPLSTAALINYAVGSGRNLSRLPANLFSACARGKIDARGISLETGGITKTLITIAEPQAETADWHALAFASAQAPK